MKIFLGALALLACGTASAAKPAVSQPYRPVNEVGQWIIEGQQYGLMKVRIRINGELVADGPMQNADFTTTYRDRPVRSTCTVSVPVFSGSTEISCSVYVSGELATTLVFMRK